MYIYAIQASIKTKKVSTYSTNSVTTSQASTSIPAAICKDYQKISESWYNEEQMQFRKAIEQLGNWLNG